MACNRQPLHKMAGSDSGSDSDISHAPMVTPMEEGVDPTPKQIEKLIYAFRWLMGRIGGMTDKDIRAWLKREGWDIDVAVEILKQMTMLEARETHETQAPGRSTQQMRKDSMLAAASYSRHQNHRRSIDVMYQIVSAKYPMDPISAMRLAYLLLRADFSLEQALENHEERRGSITDMAEVDREERRLCNQGPGNMEPNNVHKDTRIRDFCEIAGTDDWVSVKAFLKTHDWNMGKAIDNWMQSGFPTTIATHEDAINRKGYRPPQEPHVERDNMWPAPRPLFTITTTDAADDADATTDYGTAPYNLNNEAARFINLDLEPAHISIMRPDKLVQHYISKGKGTVLYLNVAVVECGLPITNDDVSWYSSEHISAINRAYNQNPVRRGGVTKRETAKQFTDIEETWIYDWHRGRVAEYQTANPGFVITAGQTWKDVVDFSRGDLSRDFNANFPNSGHNAQSLTTKRSRMENVCKDFGIRYQPARA